jgi:hypothetical protein
MKGGRRALLTESTPSGERAQADLVVAVRGEASEHHSGPQTPTRSPGCTVLLDFADMRTHDERCRVLSVSCLAQCVCDVTSLKCNALWSMIRSSTAWRLSSSGRSYQPSSACTPSAPPPSSHFVSTRFFTMSARGRGRKRDKFLNILAAPFRASRTPSPQPTPPTIVPAAPQPSGTSAITASAYPPASTPATASVPPLLTTQATESRWLAHRTEIVAGVRQVLGFAKEALEGFPVYGPAAAVSTAEKILESVQVRNRPRWRLR